MHQLVHLPFTPLQVLQTLGTETYRPSSASQCVAGIACAEIPVTQWPELIPQLVANVTDPSSTEHMKESTLEAIGYICQDIVSAPGTHTCAHEDTVVITSIYCNMKLVMLCPQLHKDKVPKSNLD